MGEGIATRGFHHMTQWSGSSTRRTRVQKDVDQKLKCIWNGIQGALTLFLRQYWQTLAEKTHSLQSADPSSIFPGIQEQGNASPASQGNIAVSYSLYMSVKMLTRWSSAPSHGLTEETVVSTRPRFLAAFQKVVYAVNFTTVHPPRPDHCSVYPPKVGDEGTNLGRKYNRFLWSRKITVQRVVQLEL